MPKYDVTLTRIGYVTVEAEDSVEAMAIAEKLTDEKIGWMDADVTEIRRNEDDEV